MKPHEVAEKIQQSAMLRGIIVSAWDNFDNDGVKISVFTRAGGIGQIKMPLSEAISVCDQLDALPKEIEGQRDKVVDIIKQSKRCDSCSP